VWKYCSSALPRERLKALRLGPLVISRVMGWLVVRSVQVKFWRFCAREGLRIVGWVKRVIGEWEWEVVVMVRVGWEVGEMVGGERVRVVVRVGGCCGGILG
jgi:hypothetical protein